MNLRGRAGRYFMLFAALAGLVSFFVRLPLAGAVVGYADFIAYWSAGRVFLDGGNPYDGEELRAVQKDAGRPDKWPLMVWQPPWVLPFTALVGLLPFWTARALWLVFNLYVLVVASEYLWLWCGGPREQVWVGLSAGLFFVPCTIALWWGQMSILVLGGIALLLHALETKRDLLAGVALLLMAIKAHIPYLLFVLVLLWAWRERRWRVPLAGGLMLLLAGGGALLYNRAIDWTLLAAGQGPLAYRVTTLSFLLRDYTGVTAWQFIPSALAVAALLFWWLRCGRRFDWQTHMPGWLIVSGVTMCYGWLYDLAVLLPVILVMLAGVTTSPFSLRSALTVSGLVIVQMLLAGMLPVVNMFTTAWWMPLVIGAIYLVAPRVRPPGTPLFPDR